MTPKLTHISLAKSYNLGGTTYFFIADKGVLTGDGVAKTSLLWGLGSRFGRFSGHHIIGIRFGFSSILRAAGVWGKMRKVRTGTRVKEIEFETER